MQGKMFLTSKNVCFYTNVFNRAYNIAIAFKDMQSIEKKNTIGFVPNAILIKVADTEHFFLSFTKRDLAFNLMQEFWTHSQRSASGSSAFDPLNSPLKSPTFSPWGSIDILNGTSVPSSAQYSEAPGSLTDRLSVSGTISNQ